MFKAALCTLCSLVCTFGFPQSRAGTTSMNFEKLVSRADLFYNAPVTRSEEGLPIGNGVMGTLVWTTASSIHFQLNRVDVFGNNADSDNFFERHTDYCGGVGALAIDIADTASIFTGGDFQQKLHCYDGTVTTAGRGIQTKSFVWQEQDVMFVSISGNLSRKLPLFVNLRPLRDPDTRRGDHVATSALRTTGNRLVLTQKFNEGSYYCGSAVVVEVLGADAVANIESESLARLTTRVGDQDIVVLAASAAGFDAAEDLVGEAMKKLDAAKRAGAAYLVNSSAAWWKKFWERSFIHLHSADDVADMIEKHYTYYLYVMASSSRGKFPAKFNGMLWTTGGDERKWGNLFWGANQSCLYNALFQTNQPELLMPMFNMYSSALPSFEKAARQQWGSDGIFIPETVAFDGLGDLPEEVATEMRSLYLGHQAWNERSSQFEAFASTKMPFLSRWNWKKDMGWKDGRWQFDDKGGGPYGHVTHIFSRGAKIAYQYWLQYEYTKDVRWLRERAYPMLKGVAEFYRHYPHFRKGADGKYHIDHVNDNESIWGGHNTVEEISAMLGIFPVAIQAASILGRDADLRSRWSEILDHLSAIPVSSDSAGTTWWKRSLLPVAHGNADALPDPNTMPPWFFDLCNVESDPQILRLANATYDRYFPDGIHAGTKMNVLSKLAVAGSLLGRTESTRYLLASQINTAETGVMRNRMDLREGPQTTSIQRLGRAAEALQLALCQAVPSRPGGDPVIHVFPAWPAEWDAEFTLACRGGFLVSSAFHNRIIGFVEIRSQAAAVCQLRNPWAGKRMKVFRNGKFWKTAGGDLLRFPTKPGETYRIVNADDRGDTRVSIP